MRSRTGALGLPAPRTFGWNPLGQLGDGTTTDRPSPTAVSGLGDVASVASGIYHNLALRTDGTVWAWGWNAYGQLGDGTATDRWKPVRVAGLDDVISVSAGGAHSLAVKADGSVWAWGWNAVGQLGDGTTTDRHAPVPVTRLFTGVSSVAAGTLHSLALSSGGSVHAWGWNGVGQLGDGTSMDRHSPVEVRTDYRYPVQASRRGVPQPGCHRPGAGQLRLRLGLERVRPARRRHPARPPPAAAGCVIRRAGARGRGGPQLGRVA